MFKKFVKDRAHNRYPAYCCDDIDERVGALEEALAALVAQTVPDGSVTLSKLAEDARTHTQEINKGALVREWIGTQEEYAAHIEENGGQPLPNVRYTITDKKLFHDFDFPIGTILSVYTNSSTLQMGTTKKLYIGVLTAFAGAISDCAYTSDTTTGTSMTYTELAGTWICCGTTAKGSQSTYQLYQRIE